MYLNMNMGHGNHQPPPLPFPPHLFTPPTVPGNTFWEALPYQPAETAPQLQLKPIPSVSQAQHTFPTFTSSRIKNDSKNAAAMKSKGLGSSTGCDTY